MKRLVLWIGFILFIIQISLAEDSDWWGYTGIGWSFSEKNQSSFLLSGGSVWDFYPKIHTWGISAQGEAEYAFSQSEISFLLTAGPLINVYKVIHRVELGVGFRIVDVGFRIVDIDRIRAKCTAYFDVHIGIGWYTPIGMVKASYDIAPTLDIHSLKISLAR